MEPVTREQIIRTMIEILEPQDFIYALWLEGADAYDEVDNYSDIDFWIDFDDAYEKQAHERVEHALTTLEKIDYRYIMEHDHPKIRQRIYHLEHTSPYLMIDVCWQLHSRPKNEFVFIQDSAFESAKVLFDKKEVIRFVPCDPTAFTESNRKKLEECAYCFSQPVRIRKYISRGQYPEAYASYQTYILEPLVALLRLLYTPTNVNLGLTHISRHMPQNIVNRLESLMKNLSLEDIEQNIQKAQQWYQELRTKVCVETMI